jgi:hypothetical protein
MASQTATVFESRSGAVARLRFAIPNAQRNERHANNDGHQTEAAGSQIWTRYGRGPLRD